MFIHVYFIKTKTKNRNLNNIKMFEIVIFIHFTCIISISTSSEFNFILPKGCKIDNVYSRRSLLTDDLTIENLQCLLCDDIQDKEFQFDFPVSIVILFQSKVRKW